MLYVLLQIYRNVIKFDILSLMDLVNDWNPKHMWGIRYSFNK